MASGEGVTVAVVDTGVSRTATAVAGRVSSRGDASNDCVGHGSFVAALIAGRVDERVPFGGVAPKAQVLAVRGTDQRGLASAGTVALGIRTAADAGAEIIHVSAALRTGSAELMTAVADALGNGAVIVAPAAPDAESATGADAPQSYWPAAYPGVLSVWGVGPDGNAPTGTPVPLEADLRAPGDKIVSTGPRGSGHFLGSGSSLAAAFATGTAALVLSDEPDLTGREVSRRLLTTAFPARVPYLDPYAAVTAVQDRAASPGVVSRRPAPVDMPVTNPAEHRAISRSIVVLVAGVLLIVVVACVVIAVPRGRSRGWQPRKAQPVHPNANDPSV
ncbi:S8 family serine peptidase [Streptomyces zhihengii]|nr:S8 family serine peptidase [Streptomyces zhihengii]